MPPSWNSTSRQHDNSINIIIDMKFDIVNDVCAIPVDAPHLAPCGTPGARQVKPAAVRDGVTMGMAATATRSVSPPHVAVSVLTSGVSIRPPFRAAAVFRLILIVALHAEPSPA